MGVATAEQALAGKKAADAIKSHPNRLALQVLADSTVRPARLAERRPSNAGGISETAVLISRKVQKAKSGKRSALPIAKTDPPNS